MKKSIIILTAIAICCILSAGLCACKNKGMKAAVEEVVYGQVYILPDGSLNVTDSKGKSVNVYEGRFTVDDPDGYTVRGGGAEYTLEVRNYGKPQLTMEYPKRYFPVNEEIVLPKVIATDPIGKALEPKCMLMCGDKAMSAGDGKFTPSETGDYVYVAEVQWNGRTYAGQSEICVVDKTSEKLKMIAELGDGFGVTTQTCNFFGADPSYTTEKHYGNDKGSLKVTVNTDYMSNIQFSLKNVFIRDITGYEMVYFYVYNDSDKTFTASLNYGDAAYNVYPHQWNKLEFKNLGGLNSGIAADLFLKNFTLTNIEGLTIGNFNEEWTSDGTYTLYYSSVFAGSRLKAEDVLLQINSFDGEVNDGNLELYNEIKQNYNSLSEEDASGIVNDYRKFLHKYTKYIASKYEHPEEPGLTVALNHEFGLYQVETDAGELEISDVLYNGERTGKFTVHAGWMSTVEILHPLESDCTDKQEVSLYIYCGDDGTGNEYYANLSQPDEYNTLLKKGEWTKITLSDWDGMYWGSRGDITGIRLFFLCNQWNNTLPEGTEFYISAVRIR